MAERIQDKQANGRPASRTIKIDALARVEGEGGLYVKVSDGIVADVQLRIYEPPRFIEGLLRGRMYSDAPDITSRICGICPIAYIESSIKALEMALGVAPPPGVRELRRLAYCGEWIESHVLHAVMLHAPDFLGYEDAFELAKVNRPAVEDALRLKKLGNSILEVVGGRAIHPVNFKVGGFYRSPNRREVEALRSELEWGIDAGASLARTFAGFDFPDFEDDYLFVSLREDELYPLDEGRIVTSRGLDIAADDFPQHFVEEHVARSTAKHGRTSNGEAYMVGPLARWANNFDRLNGRARQLADEVGLEPVVRNPFKSLLVRMVETVYACEEALRLVDQYHPPEIASAEVNVRAGVGHGCTEAPRGICYHWYRIDEHGVIQGADIIPPTSQNQPQIEADVKGVVERNLDLDDEALQWRCEQAVRNYDPCISCSTHFLDLTIERG